MHTQRDPQRRCAPDVRWRSSRGGPDWPGDRLVPLLEAVHERPAGVWIDCLGFEAFIERWDRPKTLFCLDPPDWGTEHHFGRGLFEQSDFERLSAALQRLQGRFILSLNDVPGGPRAVRLS